MISILFLMSTLFMPMIIGGCVQKDPFTNSYTLDFMYYCFLSSTVRPKYLFMTSFSFMLIG